MRLKRQPDYWEVRAYAGVDPLTGKDRYTSRTVRGGRRDAEKLLAQLVAQVDRDGPSARHTVNELLASHIDHLEHRGREARTIEGYRSIAAQVGKDSIGRQQVSKVSVKAVDDFYLRLKRRGLSPGSIQRYHSLLRAAFRQAMAWDWVTRNPVQLATSPAAQRVGRRIPPSEVVAAIIAEGLNSRNPINGVALRLLAATGARRGEVCGLRWRDMDLDRRVILIRSAVAQLADGSLVEKEPKSHQQREVAIDSGTAELLRRHQVEQSVTIQALGNTPTPESFVLADLVADTSGMAPTAPNRLTQAFSRIRERVPGAEELRLHDLRHWFASTQLDAGEPLPAVAARIGDHVETLAKVYAHKGSRGDAGAAETIGGLLG
ncbi:MAG: tyrosine-type recombinase/integrase [Microthrixaceae bacterium]